MSHLIMHFENPTSFSKIQFQMLHQQQHPPAPHQMFLPRTSFEGWGCTSVVNSGSSSRAPRRRIPSHCGTELLTDFRLIWRGEILHGKGDVMLRDLTEEADPDEVEKVFPEWFIEVTAILRNEIGRNRSPHWLRITGHQYLIVYYTSKISLQSARPVLYPTHFEASKLKF